jgi:phosphatidylethanolamine/phosphatidyl-N-methylethanolamine N-methyltransferase
MAIDRDHLERVYSSYAGVYDRIFRVFNESREAVVSNLNIRPGDRVLEVGVGTGLCLPMYPPHCSVTAIDLSDAMLEKAAQRVKQEGLKNVHLERMDAGNMTFADDSFDVIIAAYVVTAVPDYRKLMSEMIRVSRAGGRLVLLNHFTQDSPIIAAVEKAISPICVKLGFRTDLSVDQVINGWPLIKDRDEKVKPLGMWHVVECVNDKKNGHAVATPPLAAGAQAAE